LESVVVVGTTVAVLLTVVVVVVAGAVVVFVSVTAGVVVVLVTVGVAAVAVLVGVVAVEAAASAWERAASTFAPLAATPDADPEPQPTAIPVTRQNATIRAVVIRSGSRRRR
jgi:hypothetical protein